MAATVIPIIISVASTAYSAYSSYQAGREEKREHKKVAEQRRIQAAQRAKIEEKRHRSIIASQRARYGAAGLTMEGTPLLVQMESMRESEEELTRIRAGGEVMAQASERAGRQAQRSGYVEAGGAVLGGATTLTRIAGRYYDWW